MRGVECLKFKGQVYVAATGSPECEHLGKSGCASRSTGRKGSSGGESQRKSQSVFESVFVAVWFGLLQSSYTVLLQCKMSLPPTWRAGRPVPQIMSDSTLPPTRLLPPSSPTSEQFEEDTTQSFPQSSRGACLNDAEEGEYVCFGKDFKPFLPHTLGLSIVTGAAFMTFAAIPRRHTRDSARFRRGEFADLPQAASPVACWVYVNTGPAAF